MLNRTAAEIQAAADRCKVRGVSSLFPQEWEEAMRAELGISVEEQERHEVEVRAAGEARVARGEAALRAARTVRTGPRFPRVAK